MNLYRLYIDPGTGSMLFSILIGVAATLYFLFRAFIIKVKLVLSGGRAAKGPAGRRAAAPLVIYSEGTQYWNTFKPVLDAFERRGRSLQYLTSAPDDPVFGESYGSVKAEFIGEGNRAFARLNLLSASVALMTTPGLDVYQLKRSKNVRHYAHVLHAVSDATMYRLFGLDYFDSVLLSGDYQAGDIRTLENQRGLPAKKLVTVGSPYLDLYAEKLRAIPPEDPRPFTVLVSPTWGASGLLSRYGARLLDPLAATDWRIIIRPHPQSKKSEAAMLDALERRYAGAAREGKVLWDYERDNTGSLARSDCMISDFSGILFDYAFLRDRPVMYINQGIDLRPYDADDLDHELWQFKVLRDMGRELKEEDFDHIGELIKGLSDNAAYRAARLQAKETAWQYRGEAGDRIAAFMIETAESPG
jgi:hypothetical protein